jgi:hypothetical protein
MAFASSADLLNAFLTYFDPTKTSTYGKYIDLATNCFATDTGSTPSVGITDGGPAFKNQTGVVTLFKQLFTSFPDDLTWKEDDNTRRISNSSPLMIGTQTTIKGTYKVQWFPKVVGKKDKDSHYSKPLSDIPPVANLAPAEIPAFPVFTLNASYLITNLAVYLDRYRLMTAVLPPSDSTLALWVAEDKKHNK